MRKIFSQRMECGGSSRKGKRKIQRPFDPKRALHVVMRSKRAYGAWSFWRHKGTVYFLITDTADRYGIRLYRWENVGNHIHLAIRAPDRRALQAFLRVLPQRIMFAVTGARKNRPAGRFFTEIAYSRVVNWGKEYKTLISYLWKNTLQALGFSKEQVAEMVLASRLVPL